MWVALIPGRGAWIDGALPGEAHQQGLPRCLSPAKMLQQMHRDSRTFKAVFTKIVLAIAYRRVDLKWNGATATPSNGIPAAQSLNILTNQHRCQALPCPKLPCVCDCDFLAYMYTGTGRGHMPLRQPA